MEIEDEDYEDGELAFIRMYERDLAIQTAKGREMEILLVYTMLYVILEFTAISLDCHNNVVSQLIFFAVIAMSICHDLGNGPRVAVDEEVLKEKILLLAKIIFGFICIVTASALVMSSQFMVPIEVEVVDDDNLVIKDDTIVTNITVWSLMYVYGGFNPVVQSLDNNASPFHSSLFETPLDANDTSTGETGSATDVPFGKIDLGPSRIIIHILVVATKFAIARLLVSEAELTFNMIFRYGTEVVKSISTRSTRAF